MDAAARPGRSLAGGVWTPAGLPGDVRAYLDAVVARLRDLLGPALVGVYPAGSVALDAYRPGRSDLDLVAVADHPDPAPIAAALSHDALPCPAAGLEFVLYDRATLAALTTEAGFTLNLNTGRALEPKAETDPGDGPAFWYPIDRDIVHQQSRTLTGPPFATLTTRVPYDQLLPVVASSVAAQTGDNAVLNACRALRYRALRSWTSKPAAGAWALGQVPLEHRPVIAAALESHGRDRSAGATLDGRTFQAYVTATLTAAGA
ncbi:aminoglycoside adenylyltransferase domain-containing protein [Dactylosporangium sucinum]|uniref:nucleotidyltransferase domain-containing protein n=1 Tax=Dactylosporangium sucinum TaxID=1424081 RepID=UPI00167E885D|nr:nucleotidyltransferase domain-containing protein [Dactylosporangium sucinum]